MAYVNLIATGIVFDILVSGSHIGLMMAFLEHRRWMISVFDQRSTINWLYWYNQQVGHLGFIFHLYGNKKVSLSLRPIRPQWFHNFSPCAELLGDSHGHGQSGKTFCFSPWFSRMVGSLFNNLFAWTHEEQIPWWCQESTYTSLKTV